MTVRHANPEDLDLYALGALDGEERSELETHLRGCATCRQDLAEVQRQTSLLGLSAEPVAPSPAVKSALMDRVRQGRSPAVKPGVVRGARTRSWGLRFTLAFALSTLLLAVATRWLWQKDQQQRHELDQLQAELKAAQAQTAEDASTMRGYADVVGAPDTISVTLLQQAGGPQGQAHVLYNERLGTAIYSGQISPEPDGKNYQLWLVPSSGTPVDAGVVHANQQNGAIVVRLQPGLAAKAFAVTLEPAGGRPQPTGPKVLVGAVNG